MISRLLILLLVAVSLAGANAAPQVPPGTIYLPIVQAKQMPVEVVVTANGIYCEFCYPATSYVMGYLRALPGEPPASVELEVNTVVTPYEPPLAQYESTARFTPALSVTLQGQNNPFYYGVTYGKGTVYVGGNVRVVKVSPPEGGGRPHRLTIVSSVRMGYELRGQVRNDSGEMLRRLRVVAVGPGLCSWTGTSLSASTLAPGATLDFAMSYYCSGDPAEILGQGFAS